MNACFRHAGPNNSMTCKVAGWGLTIYPNGTQDHIPDILQDKVKTLFPEKSQSTTPEGEFFISGDFW